VTNDTASIDKGEPAVVAFSISPGVVDTQEVRRATIAVLAKRVFAAAVAVATASFEAFNERVADVADPPFTLEVGTDTPAFGNALGCFAALAARAAAAAAAAPDSVLARGAGTTRAGVDDLDAVEKRAGLLVLPTTFSDPFFAPLDPLVAVAVVVLLPGAHFLMSR
jgi:hypothetical protein